MADFTETIRNKTKELKIELKHHGLWQSDIPVWVHTYDDSFIIYETHFAQWLQFVFVPNHLQNNIPIPASAKKMLVTNAVKYFGNHLKQGKLLQILIEIDSLI